MLYGRQQRTSFENIGVSVKLRKERVMKCSHPECNRGIGLVSYRRAFCRDRYCSKKCRDSYAIERTKPVILERATTTYVERLFLQPVSRTFPHLAPAVVRARRR
jgi:hypothetical protein